MKNIITLVLLTIFSTVLFGQSIPNNKFENWESFGAFENPENWDTPNTEISILGQATVSKSTDAFSGSFSAMLETKNLVLADAPGLITLADFSVDITTLEFEFKGGLPLQENVARLSGMYKYSGAGNDSASVVIYNYKRDNEGVIDTIGVGIKSLGDADSWTTFTVEMQVLNSNIPDTFNVIILSSGESFKAGSVLLVDSLTIETNTGILSLDRKKEEISIFPNPATDHVTLEMKSTGNNRFVQVYSYSGSYILTKEFNLNSVNIPVSNLPSGYYNFRVVQGENIVSFGSFIVR